MGIHHSNGFQFFFAFEVGTPDLHQVFKSIMGFYFSLAFIYMLGIFNSYYWKFATLTILFCMLGLAFGRCFSLLVDGLPLLAFSIGLLLVVLFAAWGLFNLKNKVPY